MASSKQRAAAVASSWAVRLPILALLGFTYFVLVTLAIHFLRPDYAPFSRFVSEYAIGEYGYLFPSALVVLGLSSLVLAIGLRHLAPRTSRVRFGLIFLTTWGVSVVVAGIFPTDLTGADFTLPGIVHGLASMLAFLSLIVASLVLSGEFKHDPRWQMFYQPARILAGLIVLSFVAFAASPLEFKGLLERILVGVAVGWLVAVALKLLRLSVHLQQGDEPSCNSPTSREPTWSARSLRCLPIWKASTTSS